MIEKRFPAIFALRWSSLATACGAWVGMAWLAGCAAPAASSTRPVYTAGQAGQVISQETGLVVAVEEVLIQAPGSAAGSAGTGSQIGSAVGRGVLTGSPAAVTGALGGILGGRAGAGLDNQVGDKVTVMLDSGKTVVIVQARNQTAPLMPGERVVLENGNSSSPYGGGSARVVREPVVSDPTAHDVIGGAPAGPPKRVW